MMGDGRKPRRRIRPIRKAKERVVSLISWGQFLSGLLKHSVSIPQLIELGTAFAEASLADKWDAFKALMDVIWPVIVDMGGFSAQSVDVHALEAEFEAQAIDLAKLKKLWDFLSPILVPILVDVIAKPKK